MTRTRIKTCGIREAANAASAAAAGADAIGLVFVPGSPRRVDTTAAAAVIHALPPFVEPVGLFSDETTTRIQETAQALGIRTVQLHGSETPEQARQLAPLRVIKALPFDPDKLPDQLDHWRDALPANMTGLLIDANHTAGLTGGTGRSFDWHALAALQAAGLLDDLPPLILAGGLNPSNVAEAIASLHPYAVDASSGLESSRGVKSPDLIRAFCDAVHGDPR